MENKEAFVGFLKRLLIGFALAMAIFFLYGVYATKWASFYGLLFALVLSGVGYGLKGEFHELFFWLGLAIGVIATIVVVAYSNNTPGFGGL